MKTSNPHAVLLASPGLGHLIPIVELGNRLAIHHGMDITVLVVATDDSSSKSQLQEATHTRPNNLKTVLLPHINISGLFNKSTSVVTQLAILMRHSLPHIREAISGMKRRPTALVGDLFGTEAFAVADEFGMLKYEYMTSNAWFLAVTTYLPGISKEEEDKHAVLKEPLRIPGCKPVRFDDTIDLLQNRGDQSYAEFVRIGHEIATADGILVNTWQDLEPATIQALRSDSNLGRISKVPIYPIGPLVRASKPEGAGTGSEVLEWLDKHGSESVVYVSFGSGGTLSAEQTTELAWGLELSRVKFLWVVRPPMDDPMGAYYNLSNSHVGTPSYFLDGFLTRIRETGLVVPKWAPQAEILAHPAVGGFLSHCGWNSSLESIINGVPMIAWPLYAEQKMNAAMLEEEIGVAVRPKMTAEKVVGREEIAEMVRLVMVMDKEKGREMRKRAEELKQSAMKACSSHDSLLQVTRDCEARQILLEVKAQAAYGA